MLNAYAILGPVFDPLIRMPPLLSIVIVAFVISLLVTLAYKFLTNQDVMKQLKDELKELQTEVKKLKNHPEKALKVQNEMMEVNMKYMMHSFRVQIFTLIPILLIFGWLHGHMAYYPLVENQAFEVAVEFDSTAYGDVELIVEDGLSIVKGDEVQEIVQDRGEWLLKGDAGSYNLTYFYNDNRYVQPIVIKEDDSVRDYEKPILTSKEYPELKGTGIVSLNVGNEKVLPLKGLPIIGGLGWLGTYILFSMIFSMLLRRFLKIY